MHAYAQVRLPFLAFRHLRLSLQGKEYGDVVLNLSVSVC